MKTRAYLLWAVPIALLVVVLGWYVRPIPAPTVFTDLKLDAEGGFAYIHSPANNTLEIAFLKDSHFPGCDVTQMGVNLMVDEGTVVEPAGTTPGTAFDLAGAVVTFGDFGQGSAPLVVVRGGGSPHPGRPANPANDAEWEDTRFVVGIKDDYAAGPNPSTLDPNWRTEPDLVDGRIVLTRGRFVAQHPSDPISTVGVWEFKADSAQAPASFTQAMTDRTRYTVKVPGDRVVIDMTGAKNSPAKIVVQASGAGVVGLHVMGVHTGTPTQIPIGTKIDHFCAFYRFLQPVPDAERRLLPYYAGIPGSTSAAGSPSPGGLCPGNFF